MKKSVYILFVLLFISVVPKYTVRAGDEDMMSPYTQFDPETGFFLPVDPQPSQHQTQQSSTNQSSSTAAMVTDEQSATDTNTDESLQSDQSATPLQIIAAVAVFLVMALIYGFRRHRHDTGQ